MNSKSYKKKMALTFIGTHTFVSLLFLLIYGVNHPLEPLIKSFPQIVRILIVSGFAFAIYAIFAYFAVLFKRTIDDIDTGIDFAAIVLIMLLALPFLVIFGLDYLPNLDSLWVIYYGINPLFGTAFIDTIHTEGFAFLWIVSTIIPSLAMIFGMSLRLKHLEGKLK